MNASARIQQLEDELAELRETFGLIEDPRWQVLGLSVYEGRIMQALYKNEIVTKDGLMFATYSGAIEAYDRCPKILDVYVCKINRKLQPHGIKIENVWGRGRKLSPDSKRILKEMNM